MLKALNWILASRSQILNDLLENHWSQVFLVKLTSVLPCDIVKILSFSTHSMVIIDLATIKYEQAYKLQRAVERKHCGMITVFINFPKQVNAKFLIIPAITAGVFYVDSSLNEVDLGINEILKGRRVIPHTLYQSIMNEETYDDSELLTIREREVLHALLTGSTNLVIANQLFVSESTIKTHLYRVFRKIGVSSRGQAIAWAQTHMNEVRV
jgi:LuxR family transcriptional regulator, csgAB operon transcriptional regulatory protein